MIRINSAVGVRAGLALALASAGISLGSVNAEESAWDGDEGRMELTSTNFVDHGQLPLSAIYNALQNGVNICTPSGAAGGDQSPQLAWTHVPHNTHSFVVVLYDTTASFTHWGMYNISARVRALPENAGVAASAFGSQITNDFGDPNYDGPCPPAGVAPDAHHYVFTVYALDTDLEVSSSANFPAGAEQLYHALIHAAREGHILASASLSTLYSATPAAD
jgi:Raf kinase inhibitor-like YbhB/YbcL family protein